MFSKIKNKIHFFEIRPLVTLPAIYMQHTFVFEMAVKSCYVNE